MTESEQTKVCPLCAETIKAAAKVCPHCRRPQNRWFFISEHDAMALCALVVLIISVISVVRFFGFGRQYSPVRHKLTVLNTAFGVEATSEHTNVVVSGIVTNESDYTWQLMGFQVRFLDSGGKTFEVGNGSYAYCVIPSHTESSFKLDLYSLQKIPQFSSVKAAVTEAKEPGFWFNND